MIVLSTLVITQLVFAIALQHIYRKVIAHFPGWYNFKKNEINAISTKREVSSSEGVNSLKGVVNFQYIKWEVD